VTSGQDFKITAFLEVEYREKNSVS